MRFSVAAATILSAVLSVKAQSTFNVLVGFNDSLVFNPTSLTGVNQGDTVNFQFVSKNHSVTQSTFAAPCTADGVSSGFQDVANTTTDTFPTWSFTVTNTSAPLWFFCAQTTTNSTHCQAGMVFAINPNANKTFEAFQTAAIATAQNATTPGTNPSPVEVISGSAGATDGAVSVTGSTVEPSATAASSGSSASGSASSTGASSGSSASPTSASSGALGLTGSTASLLAAVGLVAGLVL